MIPETDIRIYGIGDIPPDGIIIPEQTHSLNVGIADRRTKTFPDTDALLTGTPGLTVGVRTADCVPIVIHAPDIGMAGVIHAGWRGTLGGIADRTVRMLDILGADRRKIQICFGPSICAGCYEVDTDLAARFAKAGLEDCISYPNGKNDKPHLDLQKANIIRFRRLGIATTATGTDRPCTFHSLAPDGTPLFHSWRRTHDPLGRNITAVTLREKYG